VHCNRYVMLDATPGAPAMFGPRFAETLVIVRDRETELRDCYETCELAKTGKTLQKGMDRI
jgi:hypothetical protein